MTPVQQHVFQRFITLYGSPETADLPKFLAEYTKALGKADPLRLEKAVDRIVSNHSYRSWPTVGECAAALRQVTLDVETITAYRDYRNAEGADRIPSEAEKARVTKLLDEHRAFMVAIDKQKRAEPVDIPNRTEWEDRQYSLMKAGKWASGFLSRWGVAA